MLRPTPDPGRTVGSSSQPSPIEQVGLAARNTEAVETPALREAAHEPDPEPQRSTPSAAPLDPPPPEVPEAPLPASDMPVGRPNPVRAAPGELCRYCGTRLPDGRSIVFCPACGHNLTIKHCPACNTELEIGWKYCVTCGRET
jgi:hypothetical protein